MLSLTILMVSGFTPVAARASTDGTQAPSKEVVVPVYYLTDRNQVGDTYGTQRKYVSNCKHDMYYGTAFVPVANKELETEDDKFKRLGWATADRASKWPYKKTRIESENPAECKKQFFDLLANALDKTGKDELCVFVHGADDAFEDAITDAANLAYYIERPVVMYSWPATAKMMGYMIDGQNNEYSQEHFDMFLRDLLVFREHHPIKVIMISHSMGNRLVVRSAPVLSGTGLLKDVELVSPDIDEETFKHYAMHLDLRRAQSRLRLYVSYRDKMLPLSQMLYGGYYRLGEGVGSLTNRSLLSVIHPELATKLGAEMPAVKITATATSESSAPSSNNAGASASNIMDNLSPEQREFILKAVHEKIEAINFTSLDTGFSGHSIPFKLLANMLDHDSPQAGYTLVPTKAGNGSKLAKYFSRRIKPKHSPDKTAHAEMSIWEKVVKVDAKK